MSNVKPMYVGTMNDALFIIDQPPRPAPKDYDTGITHQVRVIATMAENDREASALANVLAASPELLEALENLMTMVTPMVKGNQEFSATWRRYERDARLAIAKARGR